MGKWDINNEDAVKWAKEHEGEKFHALFCDAPYHLTSIVKRFGKTKISDNTKTSKKVRDGIDGYSRLIRGGFMGQTWDGGDIAFQPETWETFGNVMYDGAFGMAFSASRNWHRMAVAIEDAGFVIHPTIFFLWIQGQGFPKATKIRDERFKGHKYGLQALKPAVEPIIVFQKPYNGKPINNILQTGAGALNIDGGRIPTTNQYQINRFDDGMKPFGEGAGHEYTSYGKNQQGRYPANLILDEMTAGRLGASRFFNVVLTQVEEADPFYYQAKATTTEKESGLIGFLPCVKCGGLRTTIHVNLDGKEERCRRYNHPTAKPIDLCKHLATLLLPPAEYTPRRLFVPFSGSGSEMIGGLMAGWDEVIGAEFDKENGYVNIANKRLEYWCGKTRWSSSQLF